VRQNYFCPHGYHFLNLFNYIFFSKVIFEKSDMTDVDKINLDNIIARLLEG